MLTQTQIDKFYKDVESLGLKRPIAAIAEKTGVNKGNVSLYLSKKKMPSENFIKKFYESFNLVADKEKVKYTVDAILIRDLTKEIKQLKATVHILKVTVAQLASTSTGKAIGSMLVEIDRAIDEEANRLFDEDKKNQSRG
jgi:transcriptional regulator with XRE-family HTH domain